MKRSFWFKIITIIIIQAILLTQAEFALAAIFSSDDLCREASLQYQKITTKSVSLIFGIGCLQSNSKSLQLDKLFSLLSGDGLKLVENYLTSKVRTIGKEIYKVFALCVVNGYEYENKLGVLSFKEDKKDFMWMAFGNQSRGPPMIVKNSELHFMSRIV